MIVLGYDNLLIRKHQHNKDTVTQNTLAYLGMGVFLLIFIDIWHCTLPYNNQLLVKLLDLEKETWNLVFFLSSSSKS